MCVRVCVHMCEAGAKGGSQGVECGSRVSLGPVNNSCAAAPKADSLR